jgi:cytochrome c-type biogenesis protein CcmF
LNEVQFVGERLIYGNLGHLAVVLSFGTAIIATIAYLFAANNPEEKSWAKIASAAFYTHTFSVLSIVAMLFLIIKLHLFEYHYAWQHSSMDLPLEYMVSCFWEGQEGSFLLWIFWHVVIGNILVFKAGRWKFEVMTVLMLCQIVLTSMLLGINVLGYKVGSTPFELLRNAVEGPLFKIPDYLSKITDGNGLNPLLQNYWMVIHPPTLFFGFATTIVPFAYAIASLWKREYTSWLKPALPWALISVMVLGAGIIMGGFWAYESLSFGGYWAWDPVENASLVPWLILIAAVHVMIIHKTTGNSLVVAYILTMATFLLVLYATFLTRSGILGNASVHSFTDLGMSGQLLVFMFMFLILAIVMLVIRWKELPRSAKDEDAYTREFWMFIGSLMLVVSSFQIILTTSVPVFNKVFGTNMAPPSDVIMHYNKWQMPLAIIIAILTGVAQLLKYKKNTKKGLVDILTYAAVSIVLSAIAMFVFKVENWFYVGLMFAAIYALITNFVLMLPYFTGKIKMAGAHVAHIGFALLLIGVLVSSVNKKVISINQTGMQLNPEFDAKANIEHVYLEKGKPLRMGDYEIEYRSDSTHWVNNYYRVNYKKIDPTNNQVDYEFDLYPNAQINPKMGLIANPDTKHYISHDVFTYVSSVPKEKSTKFVHEKLHNVKPGDTIYTNNGYAILERVNSNAKDANLDIENLSLLIAAELKVYTLNGVYDAIPMYGVRDNAELKFESIIDEARLRFKFTGVDPETKTIQIETAELDTSGDFIIMKAIVFPWINFVWAGTIVMIVGFMLAIVRRIQEKRREEVALKA